MTKKLIYCAKS
ncbi:UNVERIFIED_CONTAM: hypothetical protein GTU68_048473 [Idotea baltica]|nr:hypothetical protein [Idotea baltica]